VGIGGGRNIADIDFGVRADYNYRDLDVLMAGPIVREASETFDGFWNSEWAVPVGALVKDLPGTPSPSFSIGSRCSSAASTSILARRP
jgi:phosphatidylserine/phosphatidylglycerophosphate/cardiolipin synthase-like enzyme